MEPYQRLEIELAEWFGCCPLNVTACSSGTAALHLALECLDLPQGSLVVVPDFTMIACPRAVTLAGMEPLLVDCDDRLLMNLDLLDKALSEHDVRAIMVVHIYGRTQNMGEVHALARKHCVPVIEDMAEAHGVNPHPRTEAACWSFYRNKIIHGEEGGAIRFKSIKAASKARQLRSLGFNDAHDFQHFPRGHNYRMSNSHAELILSSLREREISFFRRREVEVLWEKHCPEGWRMGKRESPWVYDVRVSGMDKPLQDQVVSELKEKGIQSRHGFYPISGQGEYRCCPRVGTGRATRLSPQTIYFPIEPYTTEQYIENALSALRSLIPPGTG